MAISLRTQDVHNNVSSATTGQTELTGVLANDLIVSLIRDRDAQTLDNVDDDVNTAHTPGPSTTGDSHALSAYKINSGAGDPDVVVTFLGACVMSFNTSVWIPDGTITLEDDNASANASGTSHPCGSVTLSGAGLIIAGFLLNVGAAGTLTPPAGFTALTDDGSGRSKYYYKISSGETVNPTLGTTDPVLSDCVVMAFLDSPAGGRRFLLH